MAGLLDCVVNTNVRVIARDNTGQNTKDTPSPRTEIKNSDPVGNRTRAAGLEGRASTDHATDREISLYYIIDKDNGGPPVESDQFSAQTASFKQHKHFEQQTEMFGEVANGNVNPVFASVIM